MGGFQNVWGEPNDSYGIVQGTITSPAGGNLPNARVEAKVDTGVVAYDYTDNNGRYTLLIDLTNPYSRDSSIVDIFADKSDYNPDSLLNVVVKFLEIITINFVLEYEYGPIQGNVKGLDFDENIEGVTVSVVGDPLKSDTTDTNGFYTLTVRDSSYAETGYVILFSHGEYLDTTVNVIVGQPRVSLDMILDRVNWYVAMGGNDYSGIGSGDNPFATIQTGVNYAGDDDTVYVAPDTMTGPGNRGVYLDSLKIVIKGMEDNGFATVLDCQGQDNGFLIERDRGSSIIGLTIINGYTAGPGGGIHCRSGESIITTIDSCRLYNNSSGTQGGGIAVQSANTLVRITNCEIMDNYAYEKGGGIYIYETSAFIERCIIAKNVVSTDGVGSGVMFHDSYGYGDSLINCTLSRNMGDAAVYIKNSHPTLKNTILWRNFPAEIDTFHHSENPGSSIPNVVYSDIEGGWDGVGNVDVNPFFCDTFNDDFHLAQNSPCLTAGEGGIAMGAFPDYGCPPAGGIYGTVTEPGDDLEDVLVTAISSLGTVRQDGTFPDGTYEITIPNAIASDYADVMFEKPMYLDVTVEDFPFDVGLFSELNVEMGRSLCGDYVIGDFNGSGEFNIADVIEAFLKLNGGPGEPALICECPPGSGNEWAVAMDVNSSCTFNISDVIDAFSKLKTGRPLLTPCLDCPPPGWVQGACCYEDDYCSNGSEADCDAQEGTWYPGENCDDFDCENP